MAYIESEEDSSRSRSSAFRRRYPHTFLWLHIWRMELTNRLGTTPQNQAIHPQVEPFPPTQRIALTKRPSQGKSTSYISTFVPFKQLYRPQITNVIMYFNNATNNAYVTNQTSNFWLLFLILVIVILINMTVTLLLPTNH
ncbi:hypothetical protein AMATHDRAFT_50652 [Amanita thiersii Skay4041]|uniref:Uncharacterized protein n=1 Tax=Amanita thiersii Skay4041 TaxID=703135 RepID=A0A2A9N8B4_9AGAR|nr:hypothetical protein AMATHDRAFT_50652 [Amanita thiersii Skay4041]